VLDVITYNAAVSALPLECFQASKRYGFVLDVITYNATISALS